MSQGFTKEELEHSTPFNRHQFLSGGDAALALDDLVAALETYEAQAAPRNRVRRPDDAAAVRATFSVVLANLYATGRNALAPDRFVAVGFGHGDYPRQGRYLASTVSVTALTSIRDFLFAEGLIDFQPGFTKRDGGFGKEFARSLGRVSRMRARPALLSRLEAGGVNVDAVVLAEDREVIRLRGPAPRRAKKPSVDYIDTPVTSRWREALRQVNSMLATADLGLANDASATGPLAVDLEDDPEGDRWAGGDRTAKTLVRIFNDGDFGRGGRLYGGWWQKTPKATRRNITIDGEATVELDFRSLHPRLLYSREGIQMVGDPYLLPSANGRIPRDLGKFTFMRLINGSNGGDLKCRPVDTALLPAGWPFKRFLAAFKEYHAPVAHHFGTGVGLELQRQDSDIAMAVLSYLTGHLGVVALPIHDSFVVKQRYRRKLEETMSAAFRAQVHGGREAEIGEV